MKLSEYQIVSGPNWQFYVSTGLFIYWSLAIGSLWPILGWITFCLLMVPTSLWLHQYNEKQQEALLREFPDDPYIQKKYKKT